MYTVTRLTDRSDVLKMLAVCILVSFALSEAAMTKMESMIKRDSFVIDSVPSPDTIHEVIISVQHLNLNSLKEIVDDISDPISENYQKWLSFDQVGSMTRNDGAVGAIKSWLERSAITVTWESTHRHYLKASAPVLQWEQILSTTFYNWRDLSSFKADSDKLFVRAEDYYLPDDIRPHISAIFNTVQAPPLINKNFIKHPKNEFKTKVTLKDYVDKHDIKIKKLKEVQHKSHQANNKKPKSSAPGVTTVAFLNEFYRIPTNLGNPTFNQSVFETSEEYFSQSDLLTFQQTYDLTIQASEDIGGFETNSCSASGSPSCTEGNLDVQYIMGVAQVTNTIYWYVGGTDPFTSWITDVANDPYPPQSNSMSWGTVEQSNSASTMQQFNTEAMKLASMGVTVMISSGDNGVANFGCPCGHGPTTYENCACNADSASSKSSWTGTNTWTGEGYFPSWPATCPYVVAVGATMGPENGDPEITCQSQLGGVITSGGGFSTYYPRPSWQNQAVTAYFNSLNSGNTPTSGYNIEGRGIPDISLLGAEYQVVIAGEIYSVYGTSCSSPVFAAFISLLNALRANQGLPNVGFINPTLYAYGSNYTTMISSTSSTLIKGYPYNKLSSGYNKCCANSDYPYTQTLCCNAGFYVTNATWDPVNGWGSINFSNLTTLFGVESTYSPTQQPTTKGTKTHTPTISPTEAPTLFMPTITPSHTRLPTNFIPLPPAVDTFTPTQYTPSNTTGSDSPTDMPFATNTTTNTPTTASSVPISVPSIRPSRSPINMNMTTNSPVSLPTTSTDAPVESPFAFHVPTHGPTNPGETPTPTIHPFTFPTPGPSNPGESSPTFHPFALPTLGPTTSNTGDDDNTPPTIKPFSLTSHVPTVVPSLHPSGLPPFSSPPLMAVPTHFPTNAPPQFHPTFMPSIFNAIQTKITQNIEGCTASQFTSDSAYSLSFEQTVLKTINNSYSVIILSVIDVEPSTNNAVILNLKQKHMMAGPTILVNYTVNVNVVGSDSIGYDDIVTEITNSVTSGQFTSYMQSYATVNGATALETAISNYVEVSNDYTVLSTDDDNNDDSGDSDKSKIAIVVIPIVVGVLVILICGISYYYQRRNANNKGDSGSSGGGGWKKNTDDVVTNESYNRKNDIELSPSTDNTPNPLLAQGQRLSTIQDNNNNNTA